MTGSLKKFDSFATLITLEVIKSKFSLSTLGLIKVKLYSSFSTLICNSLRYADVVVIDQERLKW